MTAVAATIEEYHEPQFSPTGLERTICERYHAFYTWGRALGYDREPKTDSLRLGTELHDLAEKYLKFGDKPDRLTFTGALFISALPHLPPPKSGGVEGDFTLKVAGHKYGGFLDYMGAIYEMDNTGRHKVIGHGILDHKTSKNPKAYGLQGLHNEGEGFKARKGFLDDIQAVVYAAQYLVRTGEKKALLRWLYYKSVGSPIATPHDIVVTKGQVEDAFGKIVHPRAERAAELHLTKPHPLSLDPNPARCHIYNKDCHYLPHCGTFKLSQHLAQHVEPKKETLVMAESMVEKALARKLAAANGATATVVAASPKVDKVNPPEAAKVTPLHTTAHTAVTVPAPAPAPIATKADPARVLVADRTIAIICGHLGTALTAIAADLRK